MKRLLEMNNTIKLLMLSDIFVLTGFGLIEPILAIFIKDNIVGGTIFAAGIASTLFFVTKSIVQLPFSRYVDLHDNKVKWLKIGVLLIATVPLIYLFARHINAIYVAQVIFGIGSGLAYPTWLGLWSVSLDKGQESFEWSLYSTLTGLGTALTAVVGAAIAEFLGFIWTFAFVESLVLIGFVVLLNLEKKEEKLRQDRIYHYHKKKR
jgi:MFS family permease